LRVRVSIRGTLPIRKGRASNTYSRATASPRLVPDQQTDRAMRLEYLCEMELAYEEIPGFSEKFELVRPYGGEEGRGFGQGGGSVRGERLQGKLRWVNHPRRRSDGTMLPDAHGVIRTDDDATVMFHLQGRTFFENETGKQLLTVLFEAEDERYRWLNQSYCVLEGVVDGEKLTMRALVHRLVHEL
jgi:hypothetical protein